MGEGLSIRTETVAAARGQRPRTSERAIVTARSAAYPQWDDDGRQDGANEGPRSSGNRILVAADQPDEAPLHAHAVGAEDAGLVGGICRFERNGVAPAP